MRPLHKWPQLLTRKTMTLSQIKEALSLPEAEALEALKAGGVEVEVEDVKPETIEELVKQWFAKYRHDKVKLTEPNLISLIARGIALHESRQRESIDVWGEAKRYIKLTPKGDTVENQLGAILYDFARVHGLGKRQQQHGGAVSDRPRFTHDCDACSFLGQHNEYDLYFCTQGGNYPTLIARYGNNGYEYRCGTTNVTTTPELVEALRRAVAKGLCDEKGRRTPESGAV